MSMAKRRYSYAGYAIDIRLIILIKKINALTPLHFKPIWLGRSLRYIAEKGVSKVGIHAAC
jgi:hypothetical protein